MKWRTKIVDKWRVPIYSWCENVEEGALVQARNLAMHPTVFHHIALMPDTHQGYGMPIGGVIACDNAVIPNAVGVDIGCGMNAVQTTVKAQDLYRPQIEEIIYNINETIPVGFAHHARNQEWDGFDNTPLDPVIAAELDSARRQLGTLGGGNHFIEIQAGDDGFIWLMLHSGSRNLGYKIAQYYNKVAIKLCEKWHSFLPSPQLAFLPDASDEGFRYITAMQYAMSFAKANRTMMMNRVLEIFHDVTGGNMSKHIDIHHNFAQIEPHFGKNVWVHRKGATQARKGQLGIIPGSMGAPSYIVEGLGNPDSFESCSHGAGRVMGRAEFCRTHTVEECNAAIDGIVFSGWGKNRNGDLDLSEAPAAYKDINEVILAEADLVRPLVELHPLGVVKG